jgi:hypothetical protein
MNKEKTVMGGKTSFQPPQNVNEYELRVGSGPGFGFESAMSRYGSWKVDPYKNFTESEDWWKSPHKFHEKQHRSTFWASPKISTRFSQQTCMEIGWTTAYTCTIFCCRQNHEQYYSWGTEYWSDNTAPSSENYIFPLLRNTTVYSSHKIFSRFFAIFLFYLYL